MKKDYYFISKKANGSESLWLGHRLKIVFDLDGEGAIIYGRSCQTKRRNGGPAYCTVQEKGRRFGNPSGGS